MSGAYSLECGSADGTMKACRERRDSSARRLVSFSSVVIETAGCDGIQAYWRYLGRRRRLGKPERRGGPVKVRWVRKTFFAPAVIKAAARGCIGAKDWVLRRDLLAARLGSVKAVPAVEVAMTRQTALNLRRPRARQWLTIGASRFPEGHYFLMSNHAPQMSCKYAMII